MLMELRKQCAWMVSQALNISAGDLQLMELPFMCGFMAALWVCVLLWLLRKKTLCPANEQRCG